MLTNHGKLPNESHRTILIIGAGLAGLFTALCLKRGIKKRGFDFQVKIFDENDPNQIFVEDGKPLILWKWAVDVLVEVGLAKRLEKILTPIQNFKTLDAETRQILVQYPPDAFEQDLESQGLFYPMYTVRECDLKRLLVLALCGVFDGERPKNTMTMQPANNGDPFGSMVQGVEADLARGNWFAEHGLEIPNFYPKSKLESFIISATTGIVTAEFQNGHVEQADMLIAADGSFSKCRDLLLNGRCSAQFAGTAAFSGIVQIHIPPADMPTEFENGKLIHNLTKDDYTNLLRNGHVTTISGKGFSFGTLPLGNQMIGWHLVIPQECPNAHVQKYVQKLKRETLSQVLAFNPRKSIVEFSALSSFKDISDRVPEEEILREESLTLRYSADGKPITHEPFLHSGSYQIIEKSNDLFQQDSVIDQHGLMRLLLLLTQDLQIPHPAHAIMARTNLDFLQLQDVFDLGAEQPTSFTSPDYHPGRVILIGDAAHAVSMNGYGSLGASLALTDAAYLVKLMLKNLDPVSKSLDEHAFTCVASCFNEDRVPSCNGIVRDARSEGGWERSESFLARSLLRWNLSWSAPSFQVMMSRGKVPVDEKLCSLCP